VRKEVALLAGSVAATLCLAEAALRLWPRAARASYAPVGARRAYRQQNAAGYRDVPRVPAKPPGVRRVVSLGDSFAWGAGVERDDAYPQRLERALRRTRGEEWEVVNLARPGMRTVDQADVLRREGFAYAPDVVLVGYVLNDSEGRTSEEARRAEEWREGPPGPSPSSWDRSLLVRTVRHRLWATAENRRRIDGFRALYAADAAGWRAGRQALADMGAQCRTRGVPLVVAVFPLFGNRLDEGYPFAALHEEVARAAAAAGARVVDLLPAYRDLRWELLVVDGARDEHPSELAHRIAANAILAALDDTVPRPGRAPPP
jgi:hypothetical protein